jgi:POLO box duplicated region
VVRWVDYSGKYGLAYQLSNSLAGMYFNDSTSIVLSSDGSQFDYLPGTGDTISGSVSDHPPDLEKKVKLAVRYKGYMNDNLHGMEHDSTLSDRKVFLADFRRANHAVLFRMSNNVVQVFPLTTTLIQINFPDHTKVVVWDCARAVRYVDKRRQASVWSLAEAVASNSEVIDRLKITARELLEWADLIQRGRRTRKMTAP